MGLALEPYSNIFATEVIVAKDNRRRPAKVSDSAPRKVNVKSFDTGTRKNINREAKKNFVAPYREYDEDL